MSSENSKTDRRVSRTRRLLRNAMMTLILEKGYNAVTVEDITTRADLGRTTFYLHYRDKEELLVESLEGIAAELKAQVEQIAVLQGLSGPTRTNPVAIVFRHVGDNRDLYRIILKGEGSNRAASRIRDIIEAAAIDFFTRHMSALVTQPPDVPRGLVASYFASAMLGFITLWLEKELPISSDQAADFFMLVFFQGAAKVLNLSMDG